MSINKIQRQGTQQASTNWIIYNAFKGVLLLIREIIVLIIKRYTDIKVELDINSNFLFSSE